MGNNIGFFQQQGVSNQVINVYKNAIAKRDAGDFEGALADLRWTLSKCRTNTKGLDLVYRDIAITLTNLGRINEALESINYAITFNPGEILGYHVRAEVYRNGVLHGYLPVATAQNAIQDYNYVLSINSNFQDIYKSRGVCYLYLENFEAALNDLHYHIQLFPHDIDAYSIRAKISIGRESFDNALADIDYCVKMDPNNMSYYEIRGDVYEELEKHTPAIQDFLMVLRMVQGEDEVRIHRKLMAAYFWQNNIEAARKYMEKVLSKDPTNPDALHIKAMTGMGRSGEENLAEELKSWDDVLEINFDPNLIFRRAIVKFQLKDYRGAVKDLSSAINLHKEGDNSFLYSFRSEGHCLLGNFDEALKDADVVLKADPKHLSTLIEKANIKRWQGKFSESLNLYNQAEKHVGPEGNVSLSSGRGMVLLFLGQFEEAKKNLDLARSKNFEEDDFLEFFAALVEWKEKKYDEVEICLKRSVQINSDDPTPFALLSYLYDIQGKEALASEAQKTYELKKSDELPYQKCNTRHIVNWLRKEKLLEKSKKSSDKESGKIIHVNQNIKYTDLSFGEVLGDGQFGEVKAGKYKHQNVAIKTLKGEVNVKMVEDFKKEVSAIVTIGNHDNIISLRGACTKPPRLAIVMELMPQGSLFQLLHSNETIDWFLRWSLAVDILSGLSFLHERNMLHRDLKSSNVLLTFGHRKGAKYSAKISDFGLSVEQENVDEFSGSLGWRAPELFERKPHTQKSDMYSFGMLVWELITRMVPFQDEKLTAPEIRTKVVEGVNFNIPTDTPSVFSTLLKSCTKKKDSLRPTAEQALEALNDDPVHNESQSNPAVQTGLFKGTKGSIRGKNKGWQLLKSQLKNDSPKPADSASSSYATAGPSLS